MARRHRPRARRPRYPAFRFNVATAYSRLSFAIKLALICAGLIEGGFSQFSSKSFAYSLKITVAAILFTGLMVYLFARRVEHSG